MSYRTPRADGLAVSPNAVADANNPAASVEELQSHRFWGRFATVADLPNETGNAAANPAFALMRPGDVAWSQADSALYQLLDRGTVSGADAIWNIIGAGGIPTLDYFTSPTVNDFYTAGAAVCPGADDFVVAVMLRQEGIPFQFTSPAFPLVADNQGAGNGWEIVGNFGLLQFGVRDGGGALVQVGVAGNSWYDGGSFLGYVGNRDVLLHLRAYQSGAVLNIDGIINGNLLAGTNSGAAGMAPSTGTMQIGKGTKMLYHGLAYFTGTLTDAQLIEHADACLGQGRLVANGIAWDNLWDVNDNAPGATWAPTLGAASLTRQGAPGAATRYLNRG